MSKPTKSNVTTKPARTKRKKKAVGSHSQPEHGRKKGGIRFGCDSQFHRYGRVYEAFLKDGVPLMALLEKDKDLAHFTAPQSLLTTLYQLEAAQDAGLNIGAATHQKDLPGINPYGFWDLDIDGPDHGLDLSPFTFRVRRAGETVKAHYLARLPDPSVHMEASYKGLDYDLCTWNTVMPGSLHESGSVYELEYLEDGEWVQWDGEPFSIEMLPMVDPEVYRALENQRKPRQKRKVQSLKASRDTSQSKVWKAATGRYETRTKMARNYLQYYAWRSISKLNGHDALLVVVTNLRLFHQLEMPLAVSMVKEHFNPRCIDLQGAPYPWTDAEIKHKWDEAGKPAAYPTLGVSNPKARRKVAKLALEEEVAAFLASCTIPGKSVNATALREAFIAFRGGEFIDGTPFGIAISTVTGIRTTKSFGKKVRQGFHLRGTGLGFTRSSVEAA
ncbi:MAG: hypothetical protein P4L50_00395 [Anaerolineaceae bacterium]|nr:hypothetical protein [Anaerolineaceae bacterium]